MLNKGVRKYYYYTNVQEIAYFIITIFFLKSEHFANALILISQNILDY